MTISEEGGERLLMLHLRNLEHGYDRKFALQFLADEVWQLLEAAESDRAALQAAREESARLLQERDEVAKVADDAREEARRLREALEKISKTEHAPPLIKQAAFNALASPAPDTKAQEDDTYTIDGAWFNRRKKPDTEVQEPESKKPDWENYVDEHGYA